MARPIVSPAGKMTSHNVSITPEDLAYLRTINANLSKAIRQVVQERKERA